MTCTHAALKRKELVTMGFKYDNILMEEAAQVSWPPTISRFNNYLIALPKSFNLENPQTIYIKHLKLWRE